jgi:catechol 2,3-dioxygenase-like lactoylglutathione lyase family enzyme
MKVLRVSFVGVRSGNFAPTVDMFRDVLGLNVAFEHPRWAGFHLPSGDRDLLEVFGSGDVDERVVPAEFEHGGVVSRDVVARLVLRHVRVGTERRVVGRVPHGPDRSSAFNAIEPRRPGVSGSEIEIDHVARGLHRARRPHR